MNKIVQRQTVSNNNAMFYEDLNPGKILKEVIRESLYSKQSFKVDKSQTVPFFSGDSNPSLSVSNYNGKISSTETFLLEGFACRLELGIAEADIVKFYNNAYLVFKKNDKVYLRAPLFDVPSGSGLQGIVSQDGNPSAVKFVELSNGQPGYNSFLPVIRTGRDGGRIPIKIGNQTRFDVEIQTFAATDFSAVFNATILMRGQRIRE